MAATPESSRTPLRPSDRDTSQTPTKIAPPSVVEEPSTRILDPKVANLDARTCPASVASRIIAVLQSGPTWAGAGSTVVTVPVTTYGAIAFGATTVWTAINEYINAGRLGQPLTKKGETDSNYVRSGLIGFLAETRESPGLAPLVQSGCFVYAASVAAAQNNWIVAAIFYLFAVGEAAGSYVGNKTFTPTYRREPMGLESAAHKLWGYVSEGLKTVLRNPGTSFCIGNLALVAKNINLPVLAQQPWAIPFMIVGVGLVAAGAVRGLWPLFTGSRSKKIESGTSSISGGIGDIFMGIGSSLLGDVYTGAATVLWGISNIFYGIRQKSPFFEAVVGKIGSLFRSKRNDSGAT